MSTQVCKKDVLQAVILTDDFSTKLTPMQDVVPSILMPVVNIPLFDYMIQTLTRSRVQEIFLYCSSHVDLIKEYVNSRYFYGITVSLIVSDECRSLGDALRDIDTKGCIRGCFLLIRGDAFTNADLSALLDAHRSKVEEDKRTTMTLVLRYVGSGKGSLLSDEICQVLSDQSNNRVLHFDKRNKKKNFKFPLRWVLERATTSFRICQIDTHIYLCSPSVLSLFADNFDFQTMDDFIRGVLMNDEILDSRIYWHQLNMVDHALPVTSWKTYHLLNLDILVGRGSPLAPNGLPSLMGFTDVWHHAYKHRTAKLAKSYMLEEACLLGNNSVLGSDTTITRSVVASHCILGSNVVIRNSYIFPNVKIGDNCTITSSVLFSDCIIENNSRIDGCILRPGINIDAHGTYTDIIAESGTNGLSTTEMSRIGNGFVYFKKSNVVECGNSSGSSNTEEDLAERNSPIPDDTNMFLSEVIDSLLRGYQDRLKCDNLILEINSSRYAYNISMREVTYNVIKAILSLPLHYLSDTKIQINNQNYRKNLKIMIAYFGPIISNYIKNEDGQDDCLQAIEDVASTTDELLSFVQHLLHQFYDLDILLEERILKWYESEDADVVQNKVRNAVQPFIKWLREAEEDSTESKDD